MTAGAEQIVDRAMGGEKALGMAGGFEPTHLPFPLAGRLVGQFGAVVQTLVLALFDAGDEFLAGGFIALELVGDDDPRHVAQALEELSKEALGGAFVAPRLDEKFQYVVAILIDGPPEVVASAVDAEIDLVQMPLVAASRRAAAQLVGEILTELQTPLAYRLVGDDDAASGQQFPTSW